MTTPAPICRNARTHDNHGLLMSPDDTPNPLLETWTTPHEAPPFAAIRPEHFRPAFDRAMAEHIAEIEAIASRPDAPDFGNTIAALERSGRALQRVSSV